MARHTILIALLAALILLVAHTASASRKYNQVHESCREQLQRANLKHCEKHLIKRIEKEQGREEEEDDVLTMRGISYMRNRESEEEGHKGKCCNQLRDLNFECRCPAMQEIMERLSDRLQGRETEDAEKELRNLPLRCGIAAPLFCDLSSDH